MLQVVSRKLLLVSLEFKNVTNNRNLVLNYYHNRV